MYRLSIQYTPRLEGEPAFFMLRNEGGGHEGWTLRTLGFFWFIEREAHQAG